MSPELPAWVSEEDYRTDVVATAAEAVAASIPPLLILENLDPFVPGSGPIVARHLGRGHSNETFLLERDGRTWVLRRPPRPPVPPSAHDVGREYLIIDALSDSGVPVARPHLLCEDTDPLGVPFYLMEFVEGLVVRDEFPAPLDEPEQRRAAVLELAARLAEVHAVPWRGTPLEQLARSGGYLTRQLERWRRQWEHNATREVPALEAVGRWLAENRPEREEVTLVHGDYKLDNVIYAPQLPARILAILDWELATLGDPLADLGFTCAVYVEPGEEADPMLGFSSASSAPGSPSRQELVEAYVAAGGHPADQLRWYECLAIWKIAVIVEGGYKRYLAGSTNDPFFPQVKEGVPRLAERALALIRAS